MNSVSVAQWLKQASLKLADSDSAKLDADLILCFALECNRAALFAHPEKILTDNQLNTVNSLLDRRIAGEPLAYLVEEREFWSLPLHVNHNVLVPRPETELIVELALAYLNEQVVLNETTTVLDAGTGSGAIAVALCVEWLSQSTHSTNDALTITASDVSESALAIAKQNADTHCPDAIEFVHSDWLSAFNDNSFNVILSNPPYLAEQDPHLAGNNLAHEPIDALVSGVDGLDALGTIVSQALRVGKPGAWVVLEHGATQGAPVRQLMLDANYSQVKIHQDIAGLDRVTSGYCPNIDYG